MNNKILYLRFIGILFIFGLLCISCDINKNDCDDCNCNDGDSIASGYDNKGGQYLTGTFGRRLVSSATVNDRLVFTTTTFSSTDRSGPFISGTYKYDGAVLTLTISGINHNKYANLSGTTLTISGAGAYSNFFNGTWTPR
jgi:hypothetical protein